MTCYPCLRQASSPIVLERPVKKVVKFECKKVIEQVLIAWTLASGSPPAARHCAVAAMPTVLALSPIPVSLVAIFRVDSSILI